MPRLLDLAAGLQDIAGTLNGIQASLLQIALFIIFVVGLWGFVRRP